MERWLQAICFDKENAYLYCIVQNNPSRCTFGLSTWRIYSLVGSKNFHFKNFWMQQFLLITLHNFNILKLKLNSVALVRERTIPTERPPPVGEVSANFCG